MGARMRITKYFIVLLILLNNLAYCDEGRLEITGSVSLHSRYSYPAELNLKGIIITVLPPHPCAFCIMKQWLPVASTRTDQNGEFYIVIHGDFVGNQVRLDVSDDSCWSSSGEEIEVEQLIQSSKVILKIYSQHKIQLESCIPGLAKPPL
jgi:hypothetical protein